MWPAVHSRLDLAQVIRVLSRYYSNSEPIYIALVKQVLRYIFDTLNKDLVFDDSANTPNNVVNYIDTDFAGTKTKRKFTSDYVFMLAGAAISHLFKLQSIITLSTCETEYVVMCEASKKTI